MEIQMIDLLSLLCASVSLGVGTWCCGKKMFGIAGLNFAAALYNLVLVFVTVV